MIAPWLWLWLAYVVKPHEVWPMVALGPTLQYPPIVDTQLPQQWQDLGGGFDPSQLAGLEFWVAADRITGLVDGDPVGTWSDLSGNGRNATQATAAAKPIYKVAIQNGLPVVRFDGVDDTLGTLSAQFVGTDGTWSAFAVFRLGAAAGATVHGILDHDFLPNRVAQLLRYDNTVNQIAQCVAFNTATGPFVDAAGAVVGAAALSGIRTATTLECLVNGVSDGATATTGTPQNLADRVQVGTANGSTWLNGDVGEAVIYSRALSTSERQQVETYLKNKWGTP